MLFNYIFILFQLFIFQFKLFNCINGDTNTSEGSVHEDNWAVIVSTSRFWFNYRHTSNALTIYSTVKRLGIPDSKILLFLADDIPCNPRNKYPGTNYRVETHPNNLYADVQVDFKGYEVTVANFVKVMLDRTGSEETLPNFEGKRLLSNAKSNLLVYLTGHGGDGFLKFQDKEELTAQQLADTFSIMKLEQRFDKLLFVVDTCEANTMFGKVEESLQKDVLAIGSSAVNQKSYSYNSDGDVGLSLIDRFTHYLAEYLDTLHSDSKDSLEKMFHLDGYNHLGNEGSQVDVGRLTQNFEPNYSTFKVLDFFQPKVQLKQIQPKPSQKIDMGFNKVQRNRTKWNLKVHKHLQPTLYINVRNSYQFDFLFFLRAFISLGFVYFSYHLLHHFDYYISSQPIEITLEHGKRLEKSAKGHKKTS